MGVGSTLLSGAGYVHGSRRARRRPFRSMRIALVAALLLAALPGFVAGEEKSECSCGATGEYKNPKGLVTASVKDGKSPDGKYEVSASGQLPVITLTVKRSKDSSTVLELETNATNWGFSPDEDRFLTVREEGGMLSWQLYDLTADNPAAPVIKPDPSYSTSNARLGFSPKGNYLVFARLVSATLMNIEFWDATTGRHHETGNFSIIQGSPAQGKGGSTFSGVTFGFGPDDRSFVYAYVINASQARLHLHNLTTGEEIFESLLTGGFWQFSPCGDVFAFVSESSDQITIDVQLLSTDDGKLLNVGKTAYSFGAVELEATSESHIMKLTPPWIEDPVVLAANPAGKACETPDADTTAPTWPSGASITASNVTEHTIDLAWSAAQDDTAVTGYRLSVFRDDGSSSSPSGCFGCVQGGLGGGTSSGGGSSVWIPGTPQPGGSSGEPLTLIGTLETDGRSATITSLAPGTTYVFKVEAVDEAANKSEDGPSVTVTTTAIPVGEISGYAWFDSNGNGQRDATESPWIFPQLSAWKLVESEISGQFTIGGWPQSQSLSDGRYYFRDLEPGTYLVMLRGNRLQSAPAEFAPHVVTLGPNQGVRGVNFYVTSAIASQTGTSSISGTVWEDVNADGIRDAGEPGIPGALVCAYHSNAGWTNCEDSDADGNYHLANMPPGLYQVWADPESVGSRYGTLPTDDLAYIFNVASGEAVTRDLGFAAGAGAIEGTVWEDTNNNGVRDSGEPGLEGIEVCQWGPIVSSCTLTAGDGSYVFHGLVQGDYVVEIVLPPGSEESFPAERNYWWFDLDNGEVRSGVNFGVYAPQPGEVHGVVWSDLDLNGQRDEGEPGVADIEVCYRLQSGPSFENSYGCTFTDETGNYSFTNVRPGSYSIVVGEVTTYPQFGEHLGLQVEAGGILIADFGLKPLGLPPVVEPIPDQNNREGDAVSLQISATDPEGGQIWYFAIGLPDGLTLDMVSGVISGTLAAGSADGSPYSVMIYVADEMWNADIITFTWMVNAGGNTPVGPDVVVNPLDEGGISIAFASVTATGETSVVVSDTGPETPAGFLLGDPPIFYDISTTATFTGGATLCIEYDETAYGDESALALFHFEDGEWVNVTISLDTESNTICGEVDSFSPFVVLERDTPPPPYLLDCASATPSVARLWPANHKMHEITIEGVTSQDGQPVTIVITAIYQDEPVVGVGSGQHGPDGDGVGTSVAELRAERDGGGDGRVYRIFFEASDGIDTCAGDVTVSVPKSAKSEAVDGGALFDSTQAGAQEAEAGP